MLGSKIRDLFLHHPLVRLVNNTFKAYIDCKERQGPSIYLLTNASNTVNHPASGILSPSSPGNYTAITIPFIIIYLFIYLIVSNFNIIYVLLLQITLTVK